jgi:hypothetical protein
MGGFKLVDEPRESWKCARCRDTGRVLHEYPNGFCDCEEGRYRASHSGTRCDWCGRSDGWLEAGAKKKDPVLGIICDACRPVVYRCERCGAMGEAACPSCRTENDFNAGLLDWPRCQQCGGGHLRRESDNELEAMHGIFLLRCVDCGLEWRADG